MRPPMAVTNAVSWRSEGIRYRKNEVFLDVVESVNLLVNANGHVVRSEIVGAVKMKCYLSGMPELRLGLNDKVMFESMGRSTYLATDAASRGKAIEMEDVKFHQCVRLSRFENDRTISFIPPDGEFELMSYRLNTQIKPLIWAEAVVERHEGSRIEFMVKVKAQFKRRSTANNVEIFISVPDDADSPKFRVRIFGQDVLTPRLRLVPLPMRPSFRLWCGRLSSWAVVRSISCAPISVCRAYAMVCVTVCAQAYHKRSRWCAAPRSMSSLKYPTSPYPASRCAISRLWKSLATKRCVRASYLSLNQY